MNAMADVKVIKTAAETALAHAYAQVRTRLPGDGAIAAQRAAAFDVFAREGLPHRRVEEWKYTDLRALMREAKPLASPPDAAAKARAKSAGAMIGDVECRRLVFVDGAFVPELSDTAALEPGLTVGSLADALADNDAAVVEKIGTLAPASDVAVALNTALMGDGAVIRIGAGSTTERPLHLLFVASEKPAATFVRSLVVVEQGARAMLIESHEGPAGSEYQVNAALELFVGDEAHVDHVKLIGEGADALHVSTLAAAIGGKARFNAFTFTIGGAVVRNQLFLRFDGEETVAGIRGASLLNGRQHADTTLVATHIARGCQSRELFKTVLDDEAHGVFQGRIIVRQGAQQTDAKMMTQALLLSDRA
jgi:Fe-S cluster assembly protein SufD